MADFVIENGVLTKYTGIDEYVVIPNGVTAIGKDAFSGCWRLQRITIPDGVTAIGEHAFSGCKSITSITIPDGVTEIGRYAFWGCYQLQFNEAGNGKYLGNEKNPHLALCEVSDTSITALNVQAGCKVIADKAFSECTKLRSVMIPDSVTGIGKQAFYKCGSLACVVALHLPLAAFDASVKHSLAAGFAMSLEQGRTVSDEQLAEYVKYIKSQRKKLYPMAVKQPALLRLMLSEKILPESDFEEVRQMVEAQKNAELMAALLDYQQKNLKPVDIGKQFEKEIKSAERQEMRNAVFAATGVLTVGDAKKTWIYSKKDDGTILLKGYKGTDTEVVVPNGIDKDSVTEIGEYAFSSQQSGALKTVRNIRVNITSVVIPDSITIIGDGAFSWCSSLTSITIPNSVTAIGDGAFSWCTSLTSITIPDSVKKIGEGAFAGSSLTSVTIPDSVKKIGERAFEGCSSLTSITIPNSVTAIGEGAFAGSSLTSITIPDSVKKIGERAFRNCSSLTNITIPDSVTEIGAEAFRGCTELADANGFAVVRGVLYSYHGKGGTVTIPDGVTEIGTYAFDGCLGLKQVIIPEGPTAIGEFAFENRKGLETVVIPDSVTWIGNYAFKQCPMLTIHAYAGSYAEKYAKGHGINFEAI